MGDYETGNSRVSNYTLVFKKSRPGKEWWGRIGTGESQYK
jgi:hypothetical protein